MVDNEYKMSDDVFKTEGYAQYDDLDTSRILTYDEMVNTLIENEGLTKIEAQKLLDKNFVPIGRNISSRAATYRTISSQFEVTSIYRPTLNFYCQTSEGGGSFRGILKILNVGMNRSYGILSKTFTGSVYTHLQDPNRIYWVVNGDFYNNGTTTVNGAVSIGLGKTASISFGASNTSGHYKYCYKTGYKYF